MKISYINLLGRLLLISGLLFILTSCSSNEKEEPESINYPSNTLQELCRYGWVSPWNEEFGEWGDHNFSHDREQVTLYFLENGKGILRSILIQDDTYFGHSRRDEPEGFEYQIEGETIIIDFNDNTHAKYKYENDILREYNGDGIFYKTERDDDWIATAKYVVMEDDERYDFPISCISDVEGPYYDDIENVNRYFLTYGIAVKSTSMLPAREIGHIRAVFRLENGNFVNYKKNPELILSPDANKDSSIIDGPAEVKLGTNVKLYIDIYIWDNKRPYGKNEVFKSTLEVALGNYETPNITEQNPNNPNNPEIPEDPGIKYTGTADGHKWIDLGLPSGTKWATMNVGATSEYNPGNYYMWAATKDDIYYYLDHPLIEVIEGDKSVSDCFWTKYNGRDGRKYLLPEDDAATENWGYSWKIPSTDQFWELYTNCSKEIVYNGTSKALKYTGPNGQYIIIPFGGYKLFFRSDIQDFNSGYALWTNETSDEWSAKFYQCNISPYLAIIEETSKFYGFNVRAVVK